jgi:hypothetical protein
MKIFLHLIIFCLALFSEALFAQSNSNFAFPKINTSANQPIVETKVPAHRTCGTMENLALEIQKDPTLVQKMEALEVTIQEKIQSMNAPDANKVSTLYKIPVVVHVVYSSQTENVSDAQIYSQIAALNRDFRKQNQDINQVPAAFAGLAADVEIEFCLASIDPSGAPTNGITRTSTTNTAGFTNTANDVKSNATSGKSPWNTSQYMNLWVCDLQGTLLGYAQFPGGSAATDGIVIDYAYFGTIGTATAPFNLGRTATHEVGHYLNLRHIWGDASCGDDFVGDTPTQQSANNSCPSFPSVTCSNGPNGDMFMNYMDYVDDACMQMFSTGQKTRMVAALTASRASLLNNTNVNCTIPSAVVACDTIANYSASNSLVVYRTTDIGQPGTGYIAGTNSFNDIGYAEKFNPLQPLQKISGVLIGFGRAYGLTSASLNVKVWKADFAGGNPGTVSATIPLTLGQIIPDINAGNYTSVTFNNPISLTSAYYIGIEFNPATLDTIALFTTVNGQVTTGRAYEEYPNGNWYPFTDAVNSWGANLGLAVAPILCIDYTDVEDNLKEEDSFQIFPNPSSGIFNLRSDKISNQEVRINVYNTTGALILSENKEVQRGSVLSFDLSQHAKGLYFVELRTVNESIVKKINLNH